MVVKIMEWSPLRFDAAQSHLDQAGDLGIQLVESSAQLVRTDDPVTQERTNEVAIFLPPGCKLADPKITAHRAS